MGSRTLLRYVIVSFVLMVGVTACSSDESTDTTQPSGSSGDIVDVTIDDFAFHPPQQTVAPGEVVRWTNDQSVTHTVTSDDELWDASVASGATFEFTFFEPGSYPYFCSIHPAMIGTIEVEG